MYSEIPKKEFKGYCRICDRYIGNFLPAKIQRELRKSKDGFILRHSDPCFYCIDKYWNLRNKINKTTT